MSLTLIAVLAATLAASVGYLSSRRREPPEQDQDDEREPPGRTGRGAPWDELPLALGDVVLVGTEERWLAGAIVARERGELIAAVFLAPEGAKLGAVVAFPAPRREILWLDPAVIESPEEPPATLEIAGVTQRRRARLPVAFERVGQGAPAIGDAGILALYEGGGHDVAVVLASGGRVSAWAGRRIEEGAYDRLGSATP